MLLFRFDRIFFTLQYTEAARLRAGADLAPLRPAERADGPGGRGQASSGREETGAAQEELTPAQQSPLSHHHQQHRHHQQRAELEGGSVAVAPRHCRHHNPLPGEGLELQQAGDCGLEDEARQEIKKAEQPGQLIGSADQIVS